MKTNIMGTAVATVQQMQSYIQKVNPAVPKSVIDMVEYYISEGKTEGVRGDIAFAQSCLETGNFTFNGSAVTLDQNNFAGIGVTKNGMKGNSFSHPWIGIRAQIQHLKAYASNEKLYGVCVDPRFCYVKRGIAPYVEWLGIQENPQGGGWAAGKNYGSKILEILGNVKSRKPKIDFWTLEEFQKVISLLYKGDYYEHYLFISYWLLFMTGMRIGEAAALQWSDIDFETGVLSINKNLYYKTMTDYKFVEPKTQAGIRDIVIDDDTIKELKEWKEVQQKVLPKCNFVLSYNGTPTSKTTLPRALEKLANLAGVHRIKIHALRHSHASLLISMGENPLIIKDRLGHEKIQTTLGTYGHLYPNSNFEVAKKLTGKLTYTPATESVADYTSNQFTAEYHKQVN